MTSKGAGEQEQEAADSPGEWLRSGQVIYQLARIGWSRGEPVMANRFSVSVHGGWSSKDQRTPPEEVDAVAVKIQAVPALIRELRRLVEICDREATYPDGSSPDTLGAHVLLDKIQGKE